MTMCVLWASVAYPAIVLKWASPNIIIIIDGGNWSREHPTEP